jgi:hypothetical protein
MITQKLLDQQLKVSQKRVEKRLKGISVARITFLVFADLLFLLVTTQGACPGYGLDVDSQADRQIHTSKRTRKFMETNSLRRVPYPLFSPDLAPSEFLFGYIRHKLHVTVFMERRNLLRKSAKF